MMTIFIHYILYRKDDIYKHIHKSAYYKFENTVVTHALMEKGVLESLDEETKNTHNITISYYKIGTELI